ncbi:MAG: hypothetical protein AB7F98_06970 [Novosphingobium sp.]
MIYILIIALVVLMAMVAISLFRGLNAFRQSMDADKDSSSGSGPSELQLVQNKMMWARIKYQFAAIVVVGLLAVIAGGGKG